MALTDHLYYVRSYIINYDEGDRSLQRNTLVFNQNPEDKFYTVIEDDTLTKLANKFYGNPILWFYIADANNIFNPFDDLEPGLSLRIPVIDQIQTNITLRT